MLDFHKITLNDGPWMREILQKTHHMSCEYCFGNHYAWQKTYDARVCRINDYYCLLYTSDLFTLFFGLGFHHLKLRTFAERVFDIRRILRF